MPHFRSDVWLPRPREEVFGFFEDPRNLESITPEWLHFRMLPPMPQRMHRGALVTYMLRIHRVPVWWGTLITHYDAPRSFVDRQLWGPYLSWKHTHTFEEESGGTRVRDHVEYHHLGGRWVERHIVRPDIEKIFAFRREALLARFR